MTINVEYDLDKLSFDQLRQLALFLKQEDQLKNLIIVNNKLAEISQKMSNYPPAPQPKHFKRSFWSMMMCRKKY